MSQGARCARKRPAKDGKEENRFGAWSFTRMRTHEMKFSGGKTETRRRKHNV